VQQDNRHRDWADHAAAMGGRVGRGSVHLARGFVRGSTIVTDRCDGEKMTVDDDFDLPDLPTGNYYSVDRPVAFWAALDIKKIVALLDAAPKMVGKWNETSPCDCGCGQLGPTDTWRRYVLASGERCMAASVRPDEHHEGMWRATTWIGEYVHPLGLFSTLAEAKDVADASLRSAGWMMEDD
jgi:hypothetical protein